MADGLQVDSKKVSEADNWCYEFKELPKFNKDREIIYTVTEDSVAHYTTQIKGFDITNTYQDGKQVARLRNIGKIITIKPIFAQRIS